MCVCVCVCVFVCVCVCVCICVCVCVHVHMHDTYTSECHSVCSSVVGHEVDYLEDHKCRRASRDRGRARQAASAAGIARWRLEAACLIVFAITNGPCSASPPPPPVVCVCVCILCMYDYIFMPICACLCTIPPDRHSGLCKFTRND